MQDFANLDIATAGAAIRGGSVGVEELTRFFLDRIERFDGRLGAYFTVTGEYALQRAREADAGLARGHWQGPLHGIPVALKDLLDTNFAPTSAGLALFRERKPAANATVVDRLEAAGAIILGKLSMTEGAYMTHHDAWPTPRNPWSPAHWTGVSSSGSGIAVAAGLCLGTLGSDTGGSIRFPSAACGITGLKPTFGRVSCKGAFPLSASLDHIGPMARTAADVAAMLQAIAASDPEDPAARSTGAVPDYLASLARGVSGLRIGVDQKLFDHRTSAEIAGTISEALGVLERQGAILVAIDFPAIEDAMEAFGVLVADGAARSHAATFASDGPSYGAALSDLIQYGLSITPAQRERAEDQRGRWREALSAVFQTVDILALPVLPVPIPSLQQMMELARNPDSGMVDFTIPFDVSGSPAITFPVGVDSGGMPIGMQLVGRHMDESSLLAAAHAYQQVTSWHRRRAC